MKVPKSEVKLTISTDSLRKLPPGASYSGRSGQASVEVMRKASTATEPEYIYVYASCDSLALQCERYERQIRNMRRENAERQQDMQSREETLLQQNEELKEKTSNGIITSLKWLLAGIVIGIISTNIFEKIIRK